MSSDLERQRAASLATRTDRAVKPSGAGRFADDLYLLARHEATGKPHLQPCVLGLGLAGGLLSELMLVGTIRVWPGLVLPGNGPSPDDEVTRAAMAAVTDVASRLGETRFLTRAATVGWWPGRSPRWGKE